MSSRQSNISDKVSKFFLSLEFDNYVEGEIYFCTTSTRALCIVLFMKGNKYIFLFRCLYNVWMSTVSFSQYLFDLKIHWIT